jgi:hypothetical protein
MLIVVQYVTEQVTTPKPVLMHDDVLFVMDETTMQEIVREDNNTNHFIIISRAGSAANKEKSRLFVPASALHQNQKKKNIKHEIIKNN